MKTKRISLQEALQTQLQDPEFRFYFQKEKSISEMARLVKKARQRAGLTQEELAVRAKTSQTVIARLESGTDRRIPSLDLLERIALALKAKLLVSFEYPMAA